MKVKRPPKVNPDSLATIEKGLIPDGLALPLGLALAFLFTVILILKVI